MTQAARPTLAAATDDGITLSTKFNNAMAALYTNHAGAAAPPSPEKGQGWVDTSGEGATPPVFVLKQYTGTVWQTLGTLNLTTGIYTTAGGLPNTGGTVTGPILFPSGTAALPSIAFDGDTNTGIFRVAADQIGFSTGGVQRVSLTGSAFEILTGTMRLSGTASTFNIDRSAGTGGWAQINFRTGTTNRFVWQMSGVESTGNAGGNLNLLMFDDAGTQIANFLQITRASRQMGVNGALIGTATLTVRTSAAGAGEDALELMNTNADVNGWTGLNFRTAGGALRAGIRGERPGNNNGDLGIWTGQTGVLVKAATFRSNGSLEVVGDVRAPLFASETGGGAKIKMLTDSRAVSFDFPGGAIAGLSYSISGGGASNVRLPTVTNAGAFSYAAGGGGPIGVAFNGQDFAGATYGITVDAASDERIKQDIRDTTHDALKTIMSLPVREFSIRADVAAWQSSVGLSAEERAKLMAEAEPVPVRIGFIAQELGEVVPEARTIMLGTHPEGSPLPVDMQTISLQQLVPYLVRAIQQQQKQIDDLQSTIAHLQTGKA